MLLWTQSFHLRSKSEQFLLLPRGGLAFWERQWVFFEMSLLLPNAFGHSYFLCWSTVPQFGCPLPLPTCCYLIALLAELANLNGGSVSCDLWHRRKVASLCVFFKIGCLVDHPVRGLFPAQYLLMRTTLGALAAHSRFFEMSRFRTGQFSRSFVLFCVRLWNGLHESVFAGEGVGAFKTSVNRFHLQDWLPAVSSCSSTISLSFFLFLGPKIAWGSFGLIGSIYAFTHVVFGDPHLRYAMQSQSVSKLWLWYKVEL